MGKHALSRTMTLTISDEGRRRLQARRDQAAEISHVNVSLAGVAASMLHVALGLTPAGEVRADASPLPAAPALEPTAAPSTSPGKLPEQGPAKRTRPRPITRTSGADMPRPTRATKPRHAASKGA